MERHELVRKAYGRTRELSILDSRYANLVLNYAKASLAEDLWERGDITTDLLIEDKANAIAKVISKQAGIISGVEEVSYLYHHHGLHVSNLRKNGEAIRKGDVILTLKGEYGKIMKLERIGLNIMQRMSAIATAAKGMRKIAGKKVGIAATRKTLSLMDKRAVEDGGGYAHRLGLYESFLIKDNHIARMRQHGIAYAIQKAFSLRHKARFIEIEVTSFDQAIEAAQTFKECYAKDPSMPYIIMLDNILPLEIARIVKELKKKDLHHSCIIEASGGINASNIKRYASSGADVLSLGCLTHTVPALDLSQRIK